MIDGITKKIIETALGLMLCGLGPILFYMGVLFIRGIK